MLGGAAEVLVVGIGETVEVELDVLAVAAVVVEKGVEEEAVS